MDHEEIIEIARHVREHERQRDERQQEVPMSLRQRFVAYMATTTGDEEQCENILAEEVNGVKDCLLSGKVKPDKQAQKRHGKTGPGRGPITQSIALDGRPDEV